MLLQQLLLLALLGRSAGAGPVQCPSPVSTNCAVPTGAAWPVRWSMRGSLYTYCFTHCPLNSFAAYAQAGLGTFAGVAAIDHYWTDQGMPCIDGVPQEFAHQDAFADATKKTFPEARVLEYRIGTAVPYAAVVHDAMVEHPEWFVRWHHAPNNNGSVCTCPPEHSTGRPGDNCSWPIRAGMYDFSQAVVRDWYLDNIIKPAMTHADGVWLDGDGPDNGCYQCSGSYSWGNLPAPYPAQNASEVDAFCAGETLMWAAAHAWLYANGGHEAQACWNFRAGQALPSRADGAAACAAKLAALAAAPADKAVLFAGDRTGASGYTADTAPQMVAAFLIVRGESWFFGVNQTSDDIDPATAALLLTDFGAPLGNMTNASAVFAREYEHATVALDCATFTATFTPRTAEV